MTNTDTANLTPRQGCNNYRHQAVRDLAWCLTSPPLISDLPGSQALIIPEAWRNDPLWHHARLSWLQNLDAEPLLLHKYLQTMRSPRLGIYFECLLGFYWSHFPGLNLLQQNLQVTGNYRTLGEFDLITSSLDSPQSETLHIEAAVKFYLGLPSNESPNTSDWHQWVGPNCNDRLDIKLQRLLQHQLPLAQRPEARQLLKHQGIDPDCLQTGLQLQGYLFYPAHCPMPPPAGCHPQHLHGLWYYWRDVAEHINKHPHSRWAIIPKRQWLSPLLVPESLPDTGFSDEREASRSPGERSASTEQAAPLHGHTLLQALALHFDNPANHDNPSRPLLLAGLEEKLKDGDQPGQEDWQEWQRFFVVADHWPSNTKPSRKT